MAKKLGRTVSRRVLVHRDLTAAGALIISAKTARALFLLRDQDTYSDTWGLVGGQLNYNETIQQGLSREITEEIGFLPIILKTIPLELFSSPDGHFNYHTFVLIVKNEFIPELSSEHKGYAWCDLNNHPRPLHPGLYNSLNNSIIQEKLSLILDLLEVAQ
jgi:ADP-ribose pyrophosphatase YjhB (NUDIX family)